MSEASATLGEKATVTIVDVLRLRAETQRDEIAYRFLADGEEERGSLTYGELYRRVRQIAAELQTISAVGQRALLLDSSELDFIIAFFGCLCAGVIAVPIYAPRINKKGNARVESVVADAQPSVILTAGAGSPAVRDVVAASAGEQVKWIDTNALPVDGDELLTPPAVSGTDIAFLQYTSGSTAAPKGVMVSHANILHNERMIQNAFDTKPGSVIVGWLPLYHDMGLIGNVLQPLYAGVPCILMSPVAFLQRPLRWLQAISRYQATTSGGPNFAYELCMRKIRPEDRNGLDLSSWRVAFNGAEPVRLETLNRFAAQFADCGFRREAFVPCYGLAEATLFVSGGLDPNGVTTVNHGANGNATNGGSGNGAKISRKRDKLLVACGRPPVEQAVRIVSPDSLRQCSTDEVGEIWISGPSVAQGYWRKAKETEETFKARIPEIDEGPFLRTGDLGFLKEGHLFITGRLKDLLIVRGQNYYPQDIELTVEQSHPILQPGSGAAFSVEIEGEERLVVVQEVAVRKDPESIVQSDLDELDALIKLISRSIVAGHELQAFAVVLIRKGTIPKTSSGKIQRHACRDAFLNRELYVLCEWHEKRQLEPILPKPTNAELDGHAPYGLASWLAQEIARIQGIDQERVDLNQPFTAYGLDSLAAIELAHKLQTEFQVEVDVAEFFGDSTITEVIRHATKNTRSPVRKVENGQPSTYPLSYGQRALWFMHRMAPESAAYNISRTFRIKSAVDAEALRDAFQALVDRHPCLRTTIVETAGEPLQHVAEKAKVSFEYHEASGWSETELTEELLAQNRKPFQLAEGPLFRVHVYRAAQDDYVMHVAVHHIVSDLWSLMLLFEQVGKLYEQRQMGVDLVDLEVPTSDCSYADFVAWQREQLAGPEGDRLWSYWKSELSGDLAPLDLPTDRPRPPLQTFRGSSYSFVLNRALCNKLKQLGAKEQTTLFVTLFAAFQALLHRLSGQKDIVVGFPTTGRVRAELGHVAGYFVNALPLRAKFGRAQSFNELLSQTRSRVLGALSHDLYPFALMVEKLGIGRDSLAPPVFQSILSFQSTYGNSEDFVRLAVEEPGVRLRLGDLQLEPVRVPEESALLDLVFTVAEGPEGLSGTWQYNSDLFEQRTIARWVESFYVLLEGIVSSPETSVSRLGLLSEKDRTKILEEFNPAELAFDQQRCVHQEIEQQTKLISSKIAIAYRGRELSYHELNAQANRVARYLRRMGVGKGDLVGIFMRRTPQMVAAMLGVWKAGAGYVPLDPQYPPERLRFMLQDAAPKLVITTNSVRERVGEIPSKILYVDEEREQIEKENPENLDEVLSSGQVAYVIYTSGSTGAPKGVMLAHQSAMSFVTWVKSAFQQEELEGVLAASSIGSDLSIFELWATLSCGGTVVLTDDLSDWWKHLDEENPLHPTCLINAIPSALTKLIQQGPLPDSVRTVNLAGEAVQETVVSQLSKAANVRHINNLYGQSETTTYSTWTAVRAGEPVRIGQAAANTQLYVLDEEQELIPIGIPGELYIGGEGVAQGYWKRASLTAERFLPNPFGKRNGARMYRTGDVVRWQENGQLEYLGRADQQVRLRGYRVELGEIEGALLKHPGVAQAAVVARADQPGHQQLVGCVVARGERVKLDLGLLRSYLQQHSPEYMVPSTLLQLDGLPLTPNGKLDRKALAELESRETIEETGTPVLTPTEELITGVWSSLLGKPDIRRDDNFFDLGGHSLLVTQVISRLRELFQVELPLQVMFESPTVAAMAILIDGATKTAIPALRPCARAQSPRLSFGQERLWFLSRYEADAMYNVPVALRLRGPLNKGALHAGLQEIVARHDVLRTSFPETDGVAVLNISSTIDLLMSVVEISEAEMPEFLRRHAQIPFDLATGPLIRACLLQLGSQDHALLVVLHHIVCDGWSLGIILQELNELYAAFNLGAPSPLAPLPVQYADFAEWQRQWLQGELLEQQIAYWKAQLAGVEPLNLPTDRPHSAKPEFSGATEITLLPETLGEQLRLLSRQQGVTLFMTLLSAFKILLHRYTGQTDIAVGTAIAGRGMQEIEPLIGFFVNTLALRTAVEADKLITDVLQRIREVSLQAYAHQDVPFERLVEILDPPRDLGRTPIFQTMCVLQNAPLPKLSWKDLEATPSALETGTSKFELTLDAREEEGALALILEYRTDLFAAERMRRFLRHYQTVLEAIVISVDGRIGEIEILSTAEKHQLLVEWNNTRLEYERDKCLPELLDEQERKTPGAVAVIYEDSQLTYAALHRRANQLARYLANLGVGPEVRVGICVQRSLEMIVGLLGILKAGGAYVPLDPNYPANRLQFMVDDAALELLVTCGESAEAVPKGAARIVNLDLEWGQIAQQDDSNPALKIDPDSLAYVIYTSGSTGRPKGVAVSHRAVRNQLNWAIRTFQLTDADAFLQKASFSFDASVEEIFAPLLVGARLIAARAGGERDSNYLVELGRRYGVTCIDLPPSLLQALLLSPRIEAWTSLRLAISGGEALSPELARAWTNKSSATLVNTYGPTEATVQSTYLGDLTGRETIPIGKPVANMQVYVLDRHYQPMPVSVPGELCIGGDGLARSYLNRPEVTADKFVPNPFAQTPGERLYRSGDLARWRRDGNLEYLGRTDRQAKIRGYRVELQEVEAELGKHEAVQQVVVIEARTQETGSRLIAYVVLHPEMSASATELRNHLKHQLPEHMVPGAFVFLAEMPYTASGKVDQKALPEPEDQAGTKEPTSAALTPTEELIADVWSTLLAAPNIGREDSFFDRGGHSLLATQLFSRLEQIFHREFELRSVFEFPVLKDLATYVDRVTNQAQPYTFQPIVSIDRNRSLPLSLQQESLWFLDRYSSSGTAYSLPGAVRLKGNLNKEALRRSLQEIVRRHEILRARFPQVGARPQLQIEEEVSFDLHELDLRDPASGIAPEEQVNREVAQEADRPFVLADGELFRVRLLQIGEQEHILLVTVHHIVFDGWSVGVLVSELSVLYEAHSKGNPSPLADLQIQYADYAAWQREMLETGKLAEELEYWKKQLASISVLELPTDHARPAVVSFRGTTEEWNLPAEMNPRLKGLSREHGVTLFMTLLAGFQILLARYSGQEDIAVGSPIANRAHPQASALIGLFVNAIVLRADLRGNPRVADALRRTREMCLAAYAHQTVPLEKLVDELEPQRDQSQNSLFQVAIVFEDTRGATPQLPGVEATILSSAAKGSKFDLSLAIEDGPEGLGGLVEYSTGLFERQTIRQMLQHYNQILREMVRDPNQRVSTLPLLLEDERRELLHDWNRTGRVFNHYAHPEYAGCATHTLLPHLRENGASPISKPVMNTQTYVLDQHMQPVPVGVVGELYLASDSLARGYANQPDLTANRFLPNPFGDKAGEWFYRTGDLARYRPDGNLDFLGQKDRQLRIHGRRIELCEIESAIKQQPEVEDAVVLIHQVDSAENQLVAYVVPQNPQAVASRALGRTLRIALKQRLAEYTVPSQWIILERLPLHPDGTLDRSALPPVQTEPELTQPVSLPDSDTEKTIAAIWKQVLNIEEVGYEQNFFDVGGHSLIVPEVLLALQKAFRTNLEIIELLQYPTIRSLAERLDSERIQPALSTPAPVAEIVEPQQPGIGTNEFAIIGMVCRLPGANNTEEFWHNLQAGVESIVDFTDEELLAAGIGEELLASPAYVKRGAILENVDLFDARFFEISGREAELLDPQHRIFLEIAWEALESAGYTAKSYPGKIGVYAGGGIGSYFLNLLTDGMSFEDTAPILFANGNDFLATRVSYKLNLTGPSVTIQTACSTSLVAVHMACRALLDRQCDIAMAGGISIQTPQNIGDTFQEGGIVSPDGHCRTFDERAQGTVRGNGGGLVVIKRLEDALRDGDHIRGVIKGSAINNDGATKVGYTAPSVAGQSDVIRLALLESGVNPETITYVEAHGTATPLGDPIEVSALTQAYRGAGAEKTGFCAISSLKPNIGHVDAAAGIAGLIKTVLALEHRLIPPTVHFEKPNPKIDFAHSPFYVNAKLAEWTTNNGPRRAGISSFGIGGTNAHVIVEEAPADDSISVCRPWQLVLLSAKTATALETTAGNLSAYFQKHDSVSLADVAYTLQVGRASLAHRCFVVTESVAETDEALQGRHTSPLAGSMVSREGCRIAFLFPGQGSQYVNVGKDLYAHEPLFHELVDQCSELLQPSLQLDLRSVLYPSAEKYQWAETELRETRTTQPALFVTEYALARLWMSWGLQPDSMVGHSIGEYVAACLAGVFSLEDALNLVALRGRLMHSCERGGMLAVAASEEEVQRYLKMGLELAAINGARSCVLTGPLDSLDLAEKELVQQQVIHRRLQSSHAFHSSMMEPIVGQFAAEVQKVRLNAPRLRYLSNLTGAWITAEQATDPVYWGKQLRGTVQFAQALRNLFSGADRLALEVGPGHSNSTAIRQTIAKPSLPVMLSSLPDANTEESDVKQMLTALGQLWLHGAEIDWNAFASGEKRRRIPLPTYPFERQRYWVDSPASRQSRPDTSRRKLTDWLYLPSWKEARRVAPSSENEVGENSTVLVFNGNSGMAEKLALRLEQKRYNVVTVIAGQKFTKVDDRTYAISPAARSDYNALFSALKEQGQLPKKILHLWNLGHNTSLEQDLDLALYSPLHLIQAATAEPGTGPIECMFVSSGLHEITGNESLSPAKATLLGLCKTVPWELPDFACKSVDVEVPAEGSWVEHSLLDQLTAELESKEPEPVVSYRGARRWIQTFEPSPLEAAGAPELIRERGMYLITGGLSEIGFEFAEWLASDAHAAVALVDSLTFPPREQWDAWPENHVGDPVIKQIDRIRRWEQSGAKVLISNVNVADQNQMREFRDQVREVWGKIDGVIHAAGFSERGLIASKTRSNIAAILAPKIQGALVLDEVFAGEDLDFMVFCSSLISVVGEAEQADYAAASAFLDSLARRNFFRSRCFTMSINWDVWAASDSAVSSTANGASPGGIRPDEAVEVLRRLLRTKPGPQAIISTHDLALVAWRKKTNTVEEAASAGRVYARTNLDRPIDPPTNATEALLVPIWTEVLGVSPIGIRDDFFDLGGDSLIGLRMTSRLQDLGIHVSIEQLFKHRTIQELALDVEEGKLAPADATSAQSLARSVLQTVPIRRVDRTERLALSYGQQRLWYINQLEPENVSYNMPDAVRIAGPLDAESLARTVQEVVRRHESLRTRFLNLDGEPQQIIDASIAVELPVTDLSHLPEPQREAEARRQALEEARQPFDLARGPLFRVKLLRLASQDHVLVFNMHHIVSDQWSVGVLVSEVSSIYKNFSAGQPSPLPELEIQYADFSAWQRELLSGPLLEEQLEYWKRKLAVVEPLMLPTDRPRVPMQRQDGATTHFTIPLELTEALRNLSRKQGATLYMILLAAFQALLSRYSGQYDLTVGSPIAGRSRTETEGLIGFFLNTLVLRTDLTGQPDSIALLQRVKETTLEAYAHQDVPFEKLVEVLKPERDLTRTPLFQVMFVLQNIPWTELELGAAKMLPFSVTTGTAQFEVTLVLIETVSGMEGFIEYSTELFEAETITRMIDHYRILLSGIAAQPNQPVVMLTLLAANELNQIVDVWNRTTIDFPTEECLPGLIEQQVARTPNAIALENAGEQLSYSELNERANQLARRLRELGVGPETRVGVMLERSIEMVVGLLGVLKAGGAYVPLDPEYPAERLDFILEDAQVAVLLTQEQALQKTGLSYAGPVICWEQEWPAIARQSRENLVSQIDRENLAYLIYTSGSTGRPKAVGIRHGSVAALLHWAHQVFSEEETAGVLASTSMCFDLSVFEMFVPLARGGRVLVVDNALKLSEMVGRDRVTLVNTVPSAMAELVRMNALPASVRVVNLAGEALSRTLANQVYEQASIERLFNLYGPSEDTTYSTYELLSRREDVDEAVSIGRAISNSKVYVLDDSFGVVPVGVAGELYIGGDGLARGYLNRPELTSEKFVPNPFSTAGGERLYRTGDRAKWRAEGKLDFLGRLDHQVKVRGFRIELGEIEAVLARQPGIQGAVVVVHDNGDEQRLTGYFVSDQPLASSELREQLRKQLPEHMVPAVLVQLQELPLTPSGKVNRAALPAPEALENQTEVIAPRNELEEVIAGVWREILHLPVVDINASFFDLGGHSLSATRLVYALHKALGVDLPLRALDANPTIAGIAAAVVALREGKLAATPTVMTVQSMLAEAVLDPAIMPNSATVQRSPVVPGSNLLLTGASGFLGAFLLAEIMQQMPAARVHCLVRAATAQEGMRRVRERLSGFALWKEEFSERIVAVPGNLAKPSLGLSSDDFHRMANEIDTIYHNGASINFFYSYSELKPDNVTGTSEILRLATTGLLKPVHYVSTSAVFLTAGGPGPELIDEETDLDAIAGLIIGYRQSKWVAERIARIARERGVPVTIYRPGIIAADSRTGLANPDDLLSRILLGSLQAGAVPDIDMQVELAPVDYVSGALVWLSRQPESIGKTFHLLNPRTVSWSQVVDWLIEAGMPAERLPMIDWLAKLHHSAQDSVDNAVHSLLPVMRSEGGDGLVFPEPRFICRSTEESLAGSGWVCPPPNSEQFRLILSQLGPKKKPDRPDGVNWKAA